MTDGLQYLIGNSIYITPTAQFTGIVEYGFQLALMWGDEFISNQVIQVFGVVYDLYVQSVFFPESLIADRAGSDQ